MLLSLLVKEHADATLIDAGALASGQIPFTFTYFAIFILVKEGNNATLIDAGVPWHLAKFPIHLHILL